jgi:CRISPR-associated protein Csm3
MIDFSKFENRYFVSGVFELEKPMHIGKGTSLDPVETDLPVIKNKEKKPFIPGSSIKGVLRSETERILRTLEMQQKSINERKMVCDSSNLCPNLSREEREELKEKCTKNGKLDEKKFAEKILERLCIVCGLFGSTDSASHILIKDMPLLSQNIKTEIRDGVAIDRDTGTAKDRHLYNFEIVPAESKFKFEAILENVEEWQIGLFGIILKLWERGEIAIGGKKTIGMGFGKLKNISIKEVDAENLIEYIISGELQEKTLESYIEIFQKKLGG